VHWSGDPTEFAWVAPVVLNTQIQLSSDAWFAALDASTQPIVYEPPNYDTSAGCALAGCGNSGSNSSASGTVQVVRSSVVGPYETVTVHASDPGGLPAWLRAHGYAVPDAIAPIAADYAAQGFDFVALRLRPNCSVNAMRPIRLVMPGVVPSIPLRMMAAGTGRLVGITLWVLGEGRYAPQNYPSAELDDSKLVWQKNGNKSNYASLATDLMAQQGGRTWILDSADYTSAGSASHRPTPYLIESYAKLCNGETPSGTSLSPDSSVPAPCGVGVPDAAIPGDGEAGHPDGGVGGTRDSGMDTGGGDSGAEEAGLDAEAGPEAGEDGGVEAGENAADAEVDAVDGGVSEQDAGSTGAELSTCGDSTSDDLAVGLKDFSPSYVFVTRFSANLTTYGLTDLHLTASTSQTPVTNAHQALAFSEDTANAPNRSAACASSHPHARLLARTPWALACAAAIALFFRRLSRRRK
jgi:hypothetical protein